MSVIDKPRVYHHSTAATYLSCYRGTAAHQAGAEGLLHHAQAGLVNGIRIYAVMVHEQLPVEHTRRKSALPYKVCHSL